jgi:hypothetical protein
MYIPTRLQEIAEVLKYKTDVVAGMEIRWQGTGKIDKSNYTFCCKKDKLDWSRRKNGGQ